MRQRSDELLRPDARTHVCTLDDDAEATTDPARAASRNAAVPAEGGNRSTRERVDRGSPATPGTGSHGVPIEQSTTPPGSESARRFSVSSRS